jgi:hypothetical protein
MIPGNCIAPKRCYGSMKATPWTRWLRACSSHRARAAAGASRFQTRQALALPERRAEGLRSGRPTIVSGLIETLRSEVIDGAPRPWGYHATVWTAPRLCQYLRDVQHLQVSRRSGGLALARLAITWKRPRYALARRAATWRQAQGGSNAGSQAARAR